MNILEALKKYIRANGGSSRANNISEAVKDLDSIPQGSGGGGMVVTVDFDESYNGVADKTLDEIIAAFDAGTFVSIKMLLMGAFYLQAPLMIGMSGGEPEDQHIQARFEVGEIAMGCDSGTTWVVLGAHG